jgi:hypothetical protein
VFFGGFLQWAGFDRVVNTTAANSATDFHQLTCSIARK